MYKYKEITDGYTDQYNALARRMFAEFALENSQGNTAISPLSVIVLLAMAAEATGGETRDEIAAVLDGDLSYESARRAISLLQKGLLTNKQLMSSNAAIVNKLIEKSINPDYRESLASEFGGELFCTKDIVRDVNAWVEKKTDGMIREIADDSMKDMLLALINAVSFKADWQEEYEEDDIEDGEFNNADGTTSPVQMLRKREDYYIENESFTGFLKPYKDSEFYFMGLLPKEPADASALKQAIETIDFTSIFKSARYEDVIVTFPEYTGEFEKDLTELFKRMGINTVFSEHADFSPLSSAWLKAEAIVHKAKIEVDRNGTRAAAVTVMYEFAGACFDFDPKEVTLDRPFVYAIMHEATGLPIFVGMTNEIR